MFNCLLPAAAGKVVAMGSTAKLHASGKNFLGYPCEWCQWAAAAMSAHLC
jgi:hypothetical protein